MYLVKKTKVPRYIFQTCDTLEAALSLLSAIADVQHRHNVLKHDKRCIPNLLG